MTRRGVPATAILASSVVGFLSVIAAAVSPDTIFAFLLNSSGAIILFVYLLICISQIVLRYRTPDSELRVKMWLFPVLSILTAVAIVGILLQMGLSADIRSQLILSLLSWAVVLVLYFANKWFINRRPEAEGVAATEKPRRVLVMANETGQLRGASRRAASHRRRHRHHLLRGRARQSDRDRSRGHPRTTRSYGRPPSRPPRRGWTTPCRRCTRKAPAEGALGDYRPLRALAEAVDSFHPDQIVIATLPPEDSVWHRFDVVDRARAEHGVPVTHVVATQVAPAPR